MAVSAPPPPETAGSVPPQNTEAETSVLGAILLTEQALDGVLLEIGLRPEDFYRPRHQLVFGSMLRLKEKPEPEAVDALTVCDDLKRSGELEQAGGEAYVHSLPTVVPAVGNVLHYARIVKDYAMLRRLLGATREIQDQVLAHRGDPRELIDRFESNLLRIGQEDSARELSPIEEVLHTELDVLEKLSQSGVSMTGTPSGFTELDEMTGGFQPGNLIVLAARPAMGKCLGGSALVFDPATGSRRPLREVVETIERGEESWVAALGDDLRIRRALVSRASRSGAQPLYRLTTKLGRRLDATANHPLLTLKGWTPLDELRPGDRLAVPRKLPASLEDGSMPDHEIVLLAALIADGSLTGRTPRFCYGPSSPVLAEVEKAATAMGLELRLSGGRDRLRGYGSAYVSAGRGSGTNPLRALLERHGIWGKRSGDKFVPDAIFGLEDAQIKRFLSILYGCDGHIHVSDRLRQVGYTTISERLASDVQHLLLRLGIVATIRTLRRPVYDGTGKVAREVRITGQTGLTAFCEGVGAFGKDAQATKLLAAVAVAARHTNVDTIPAEIWGTIRVVTEFEGMSLADLSAATGRPRTHNWHVGRRGLSRSRLGEVAAATGDEVLNLLAASDIWWDEIASIEPIGEEETFDLEVPDHHNFVADDIVVHNSALATNIAENAAVEHGKAVALFSLEMSERELAQRFIATRARISSDDLRKGRVKTAWPKVVKAADTLAKAPLWIDDSSDLGILELRAKARRLHNRTPLGLLIIDYLQLMRAEDPSINRVEQVGRISRGLKILARELNIPVIAVSQLSRAVESRPDKHPILSDLRESGNVEQDADLVMFIYRDEYYNDESERPGEADVSIAKHRNGPVGRIALAFQAKYPKFTDLYRERTEALETEAAGAA